MERKWFKIGSGVAVSVTTIVGLFLLLTNLYNFQITGTDDICLGTREHPCISYVNVTNPNTFAVDVYNQNEVRLQFNPQIPEYYLFRKDGRCRGGQSCAAPNGVSLSGWNFIDFTNRTKPDPTKAYVFRFPARETKEFLLWGLKNNPDERIKWSFVTPNGELDPVWEGEVSRAINVILNNKVEAIVYATKIVDNLVFNSKCGVYYDVNKSYAGCYEKQGTKTFIYNTNREYQELFVNGVYINTTNYWCYEEGTRVICKSTLDGDGNLKKKGYSEGMQYFIIDSSDKQMITAGKQIGEYDKIITEVKK